MFERVPIFGVHGGVGLASIYLVGETARVRDERGVLMGEALECFEHLLEAVTVQGITNLGFYPRFVVLFHGFGRATGFDLRGSVVHDGQVRPFGLVCDVYAKLRPQ